MASRFEKVDSQIPKELVALAHNFVEQELGTSSSWVPKAMRLNFEEAEEKQSEDE